mgnify:FL=1
METTPQTPQQQDTFKTIVDKGAISDLLSFLGRVFGNSELIAAAKIELSLMQDAYIKATEQKAEVEVDFGRIFHNISFLMQGMEWEEDVCVRFPDSMDVQTEDGSIEVTNVQGKVSMCFSQKEADGIAQQIVDGLKKELQS